jgi:hypothetical protein
MATFREWLADKIRGGSAEAAGEDGKPKAEPAAATESGAEAPAQTEHPAAAESKPAEQESAQAPAQAEQTAAAEPKPEEPAAPAAAQDARAQFGAMVEAIGESAAAAAFAAGLTLEQAIAEHHKFLKAENADLRKRLEALGSAGSTTPATFTPAAETPAQGKTFRDQAKAATDGYSKK